MKAGQRHEPPPVVLFVLVKNERNGAIALGLIFAASVFLGAHAGGWRVWTGWLASCPLDHHWSRSLQE